MTYPIENYIDNYMQRHNMARDDERIKYISFSDNEKQCNEEIDNLTSGQKHATCQVYEWYKKRKAKLPQEDMLVIFADFYGAPKVVAKITKVETIYKHQFNNELAARMGTGDYSHNDWRVKTLQTMDRRCETLEIASDHKLKIVIVWIEVLFPYNIKKEHQYG